MSWFKVLGTGYPGKVLVLVVAALITACGFRLRGTEGFSDSMATTYIDAEDRYTRFYRELVSTLSGGGVEVVDSVVDASAIIRISKDSSGQDVLTVSARNVPTEYNVFYVVEYSVWIDGQEVLPEHSVALSQDYTYDTTLVLGKNRESEAILESIVGDVVRQVSQELSRL
ncbi:MAG: hypothetical protein QF790_06335 [Gammaproteobacteria bacterium]|jgi:LPS-assembly lipoprotein|nr:hypothetical protein [Gammaproteobacteria bacterium]MDP6616764.1 hypothetical protein [Gammaproteobacteria bacterium]MDP6695171.1 hypothetical protein [Gammaproteobacteria bacterium]MDP7041988.1 hypothetical protein [Gammaproteobacteria bacterium]